VVDEVLGGRRIEHDQVGLLADLDAAQPVARPNAAAALSVAATSGFLGGEPGAQAWRGR